MIKNILIGSVVGIAFAAVLSACSSGGGGSFVGAPGSATSQYKQIELLSRPAVKEAFETFSDHDTTNKSEPYNDPTLQSEIGSFTTTVAGRSAATASGLQAVLYPNEMIVDLSSSATSAAYLGVESGGATGSTFGGRALSDDVIDISLGAIFGNTLAALGVAPDDGKESPCLTTDHVSYQATTGTSFPYAQGPL